MQFHPSDFLVEAIEEFLQSGADASKIGSCIIKIAIATELLLKDKLERICPALILENIDPETLQVVRLYKLEKQMLVPIRRCHECPRTQ